MINKLILVLGPESTGTRWLSSVFSCHPNIEGPTGKHQDTLDKFWTSGDEMDFLEAIDVESEAILARRSIPAGVAPGQNAEFGVFQDFGQLAELCSKHKVILQVLITTRSVYPHLNSWTRNRASVNNSMVKSYIQYQKVYRYLFNWINEYRLSFLIVSLESAIYEEADFVKGVWKFLGFESCNNEFSGNKLVNAIHYENLRTGKVDALNSQVSKKVTISEEGNRLNLDLCYTESGFTEVFDSRYQLSLNLTSLKEQRVDLTIQSICLKNVLVTPTEPFELFRESLSLVRYGKVSIEVSCLDGNIGDCSLQADISVLGQPVGLSNSDLNKVDILSNLFMSYHMIDRQSLINIASVLSDSHRYKIVLAFVNSFESISYLFSLHRYSEVADLFAGLGVAKVDLLIDTIFSESSRLLEAECSREFSNRKYDLSAYIGQIKAIFISVHNQFKQALVEMAFTPELKRNIEEDIYKLINLFLIYDIAFEDTSNVDIIRGKVVIADSRKCILDFFQSNIKVKSILSTLRESLEGYSMAELQSYITELKSQIKDSEDCSKEQLESFKHSQSKDMQELSKRFSEFQYSSGDHLSSIARKFESFKTSVESSVGELNQFKATERKRLRNEFAKELAQERSQSELLTASLNTRFNEIVLLTKELSKTKDILRNIESNYSAEVKTLKDSLDSTKSNSLTVKRALSEANETILNQEISTEQRYREIAVLTERCEYLSEKYINLQKIYQNTSKENIELTRANVLFVNFIKNKRNSLTFKEKMQLFFFRIKLSKSDYSDYSSILYSGLFDSDYYLSLYEDIANSKTYKDIPLLHYVKFGWKEFRDPSPDFSTQRYLDANDDVRFLAINPLVHFIKSGFSESRML